jgi:hypothetical protein
MSVQTRTHGVLATCSEGPYSGRFVQHQNSGVVLSSSDVSQIALRVHRLLDLPAYLLAPGADSEVHLSYLRGLLTLLSTSDIYVKEWVRVFYASVWIDPGHQWMRFRFEREDALFMLARFASCLDLSSRRLAFTACAMVLLILLDALTMESLRP